MLEPWYLPGLEGRTEWREGRTAAGLGFRVPLLDGAVAGRLGDAVRVAALRARRELTTQQVIRAVAAAAGRLAGDGPEGAAARQLLNQELGWGELLARDTLQAMSLSWTEEALGQLVEAEVRPPGALDGFARDMGWKGPGARWRRAAGPPVMLQVLAGNVPGVAITATVRSLLARSGVLCKVAEAEPGLLPMFARLLAEEEPLLGRAVAVTWWPGSEFSAAGSAWTALTGRVVVYGGAQAVEGVRKAVPAEVDVVAYGPRTGIGVILPGAEGGAELLARDVWAYDQQGCVSPRLVYVAGGSAREFAGRLAGALATLAQRQPPPPPTDDEAVGIRALRAEYEFGGYGGMEASVESPGDELTWTVLASEQPGVRTEPVPRVVWVHRVESLEQLFHVLAPLEGRIQSLGYVGTDGIEQMAEEASRLGVSRIAPLGTVAWPPSDWRHEGRFQLLPLLNWTEFETAL